MAARTHLLNLETGDVIEFHAAKIEALPAEIARRPEGDAVSLKKDRA